MNIAVIRSDYFSALLEGGLTHAQIIEDMTKFDVDESQIQGISKRKSDIDGYGIFADKAFSAGDTICHAISNKKTIAGRYTNHSPSNNAILRDDELIALIDITPGEEITVNYRDRMAETTEIMNPVDAAVHSLMFSKDHINQLTLRERVLAFEAFAETLPQVGIPTTHEFIDGLYKRQITLPAGTLATGKIHPVDHMDVMLSGEMLIATESGYDHLVAPLTLTSRAGVKKAGQSLTDVVWVTYHPTRSTTVEDVEKEIFAMEFNEITATCTEVAA